VGIPVDCGRIFQEIFLNATMAACSLSRLQQY
jgi:hypothetical protein